MIEAQNRHLIVVLNWDLKFLSAWFQLEKLKCPSSARLMNLHSSARLETENSSWKSSLINRHPIRITTQSIGHSERYKIYLGICLPFIQINIFF